MPGFDFITPDAFSLTTLTASINNLPYKPGQISAMGVFEEKGIPTTSCLIESKGGVLTIVPVVPRSGVPMPIKSEKRTGIPFAIPHIPQNDRINADEIQGVRMFGSENQAETFEAKRDERLGIMKNNIDYTMEAHRLAAVKGVYYDAYGNTASLFDTFGVTQSTLDMALDVSTTEVHAMCEELLEKIEAALDGTPFTGVEVMCGATFWKKLITHPSVKATYQGTQMAASLRRDPRLSFDFGNITWSRYRGNSEVNIGTNDAYAIPTGVTGLFLTRFAPANYIETINTVGLPYYSKAVIDALGKGMDVEAQSNPLNICTRPASIVKLGA